MKTKTKSTVARRRVKRRQERVSHKKLRTLRSRKYARKTVRKVMRGGGLFGENKNNKITTYVVYDEIPFIFREPEQEPELSSINVPICVILIKPKKPIDEIYLFFNQKMTSQDITLTVKLLLGISDDKFKLNPNITPVAAESNPLSNCSSWPVKYDISIYPAGTVTECIKTKLVGYNNQGDGIYQEEVEKATGLLWGSLGTTFVKLCGVESGLIKKTRTYYIETGTFDPNQELDEVTTVRHDIPEGAIKDLNVPEIKKFLEKDDAYGFKGKILDSDGVLQDLYKDYYTPKDETALVTDEDVNTKFGEDLEGKDKNGNDIKDDKGSVVRPWWKKAERYETFKSKKIQLIREKLEDTKQHNTYGLDESTVSELTKRPLRITKPIDIEINGIIVSSRISSIIINLEYQLKNSVLFTNLLKGWWTIEEEKALKKTVDDVSTEKKQRIDVCMENPGSIDCHKENYR